MKKPHRWLLYILVHGQGNKICKQPNPLINTAATADYTDLECRVLSGILLIIKLNRY